MNYKLFNLLIFITTLGFTAPAPAAAGHLEQQTSQETHLVCHKQAQHWLCDIDKSSRSQVSAEDEGAVQQAQETVDSSSPAKTTSQVLSPAQQRSIANTLIWLSYLVPSGLGLSFFLYYRYHIYRDAILQRQVATLERLWQHGLDNDATSDTEQGAGS